MEQKQAVNKWILIGGLGGIAALVTGLLLWPSPKAPTVVQSRSGFETSHLDEATPVLSADGQQVFFSRFDQNSSNIYRRKLIDGHATELVASREVNQVSPALSPDGELLAYFALSPLQCRIMLLEIASDTTKPLSFCGIETNSWTTLEFAANGRFLLTSRVNPHNQDFEIVEYEVNSGEISRTVAPDKPQHSYSKPDYSPDGDELVFVNFDAQTQVWQLVRSDWSGQIEVLFESEHHIFDTKWTPLGIYYSLYNAEDASGVWYRDESNRSSQLTKDNVRFFDISNDGKVLLTAEGSRSANVWQYALGKQRIIDKQPVTANRQYNHSPQVSPDGQWISFISNRSGENNLWLTMVNEKQATMLTRFDNGKFIGHRWSDDSKTITFSHSDGRRDKLFKTGIVPGTTQPLNAESKALLRQPSQAIIDDLLSSSDGQDFAQSQWLVNGEYLYQLTNLHQGWHLLKRQLDGLHEVQRWRIPENIKPQSMFDLDEDGKVLFISILEEISSDLYVYQL